MKILLLLPIKCYWFLIPPEKRNSCLFKESCSRHVFRITIEKGLLEGVKALRQRYNHCRPGYCIINHQDEKLLISIRNKVFKSNLIKNEVLQNE